MRRWRERLKQDGYDGLADRRKGKVSPKRVSLEVCERVPGLYRERYYDLNMRHFHEKLQEEQGIELSYSWVQKALQGAGLVTKRSKRGGIVKFRQAFTILRRAQPTPGPQINKLAVVLGGETANKIPKLTIPLEDISTC